MFLAAEIPTELERIIEFLNDNPANTEVSGVAVSMHVGDKVNVYVPCVVGQTARALEAAGGRHRWGVELPQRRTRIDDLDSGEGASTAELRHIATIGSLPLPESHGTRCTPA